MDLNRLIDTLAAAWIDARSPAPANRAAGDGSTPESLAASPHDDPDLPPMSGSAAGGSYMGAYDAARRDRLFADWFAIAYGPNAFLNDAPTINARAREMIRNNWAGASLEGAYRRNVVGTGITPLAMAWNPRTRKIEDLHEQFNNQAMDRWNRLWHDPSLIDVEGRRTGDMIVDLAMRECLRVGNGFIVHGFVQRDNQVGLTLQGFEFEQLAKEKDRPRNRSTNAIVNGIEVDRFNRPAAYWVHMDNHPDDAHNVLGYAYEDGAVRLPAERVLHLHDPSRWREVVAPSRYAPILVRNWMRESYDSAEQIAKKIEAFLGMVIQRDPRYVTGPVGFAEETGDTGQHPGGTGSEGDGRTSGGNRELNFQPGSVPELFPGEEIKLLNPQRPGGQYEPYMKVQNTSIAAGSGISYPMLARDFTVGSYGSLRAGMLEDWKQFDMDQLMVIYQVLDPIWRLFINYGVLQGLLHAPGYYSDPLLAEAWQRVIWAPPPRDWIDPAKDAVGTKIRLDYGLTSHQRELLRRNIHWRQLFDEIKESADYAGRGPNGFPLPQLVQWMSAMSKANDPKVHGGNDSPGKNNGKARTQGAFGSDDWLRQALIDAIARD